MMKAGGIMIRENVIDAMNRISENVMISKLIYRSKFRHKSKVDYR